MWVGLSWVELGWSVVIGGISLAGTLSLLAPSVSLFLNDLVKYGKSHSKDRSWIHHLIEVPKRWFVHFYIVALIATSLGVMAALNNYVLFPALKPWTHDLVHTLTQGQSTSKVPAPESAVLLCLLLYWLHALRRLWETLFLCVYSETKMNLIHYAVGIAFYSSVPACLLSQTQGFRKGGQAQWPNLQSLGPYEWAGLLLFLWSSYSQHSCFVILARMRKSFNGNITTYAHGIPIGGWFEESSCPHFCFEILIYFSLFLLMGFSHRLWGFILLFVFSNQLIAAQITHKWYKDRFKDYPPKRTAIFPYLF